MLFDVCFNDPSNEVTSIQVADEGSGAIVASFDTDVIIAAQTGFDKSEETPNRPRTLLNGNTE